MLARIKNAAALHTPSHLQSFNQHLPDFGPVYASAQTRNFASGSADYIDILVATEMDETIVDALGNRLDIASSHELQRISSGLAETFIHFIPL
jgi:hypothetical protein